MGMLVTACSEPNEINPLTPRTYEDWTELIIPGGREALAIAGDIRDTLLVTTYKGVYATADAGKTWYLSLALNNLIYDVVERADTIFLLYAIQDVLRSYPGPPLIEEVQYAVTRNTYTSYYTTDKGGTWESAYGPKPLYLESPIGIAESPTGVVHKLVHEKEWLSPNSYQIKFSDIDFSHESDWQTIDFPLDYVLNNLHVDRSNRLYVTANNAKFIEERNIQGPSVDYPALVYVYKRPLP